MKTRAHAVGAWAVSAFLIAASSSPSDARAETPRIDAEASCALGDEAESALRYADAIAAYRRAITLDPSAPCASGARARAEDLEAHAEGGFRPLAILDAVRHDPAKMADRRAIEALAAAVATFPEGPVRVEARVTLAHAYGALKDPERAVGWYTEAVRDRSGARPTRALALSELCALLQARGSIEEAYAEVLREPDLSPSTTTLIQRARRHGRLIRGAESVLAVMGLLFVAASIQLARRARDVRDLPGAIFRPFSVGLALYIGGAAALLVRARGEGDPQPFLWLGFGVLGMGGLARALPMAFALRSPVARGVWATTCVLGLCAAAIVAVDRVDASYLDGLEGLGL